MFPPLFFSAENSLPIPYLAGVISQQEFKDLIVDLLHTTTTRWGALETPLDGYVGFDTVLEQQRRKFLKKGFEFNLMVVGKIFSFTLLNLILLVFAV